MVDARPGNRLTKTVLTYHAIPIKNRRKTEKTIIVETLNDWDTSLIAGIIRGRRDQQERIMKVSNVRLFSVNQTRDSLIG